MEGPPPRFRCPPEFEAAPGGGPLGGPQAELWLIRAPNDFCPQSLEGLPVPLNGLERLRPAPGATSGDNDNDNDSDNATTELFVLRGGPAGDGDCPLLLSPMSPGGALACAPPLRGSLSITRSFGATPGEGTARVALGDTAGTTATAPPTEGTEGPGPPRVAPEEPKRRKKRKKKREEGQE